MIRGRKAQVDHQFREDSRIFVCRTTETCSYIVLFPDIGVRRGNCWRGRERCEKLLHLHFNVLTPCNLPLRTTGPGQARNDWTAGSGSVLHTIPYRSDFFFALQKYTTVNKTRCKAPPKRKELAPLACLPPVNHSSLPNPPSGLPWATTTLT